MSCSTMVDQILEADLDMLDGRGHSDVARHIRECAHCRAMAGRIVGDTRSLAAVMAAVRPPDPRTTLELAPTPRPARAGHRNHGRIAALASLAAALGVLGVREWPRRVAIADRPPHVVSVEAQRSVMRDPGIRPATVIASRPVGPRRGKPIPLEGPAPDTRDAPSLLASPTPRVLATVAERTIVKPVGLPSGVAPVRLDTTGTVALGGTVVVDPPTGTRASIIRTPNPTVTVVWLYQ